MTPPDPGGERRLLGPPLDGAAIWRRITVAVSQLANPTPPGLVH
jgi:hypothetical protein